MVLRQVRHLVTPGRELLLASEGTPEASHRTKMPIRITKEKVRFAIDGSVKLAHSGAASEGWKRGMAGGQEGGDGGGARVDVAGADD